MVNKNKIAETLLRIRYFEDSLDNLFEEGRIFGTYHRCIGQEATAVAFTHTLDRKKDYVVSNHRNHGHYLSFSNDYEGLLRELQGSSLGVSGGRGGSQVIFGSNFVSNGILGSTVSFATGLSLAQSRLSKGGIVICFMGDGALGEGVVYESLNMASLWNLPILYVVENNGIAQSTKTSEIMAGKIEDRFTAFNIETIISDETNVFKLLDTAEYLISKVRADSKPLAISISADRLCAHSKGDDTRNKNELSALRDPVNHLKDEIEDFEITNNKAQLFINKLIGDS